MRKSDKANIRNDFAKLDPPFKTRSSLVLTNPYIYRMGARATCFVFGFRYREDKAFMIGYGFPFMANKKKESRSFFAERKISRGGQRDGKENAI